MNAAHIKLISLKSMLDISIYLYQGHLFFDTIKFNHF